MTVGDLLTPWLVLAAVLVPLVYVEKWIHSHLYGVGWLLTNDYRSATILYYVLLLPGVFMHEAVQWLVAGAINVETKTLRVWPEPQEDGTLRLDFIQVQKTNRLGAAIIGAAPLIVGLALVWVISNYILNLDDLLQALGTGNLRAIGAAIRSLGSAPDFYLWLYLLFALSNAMLPTPADRQGWFVLIAFFAGIVLFLVVIGTGEQLLQTYKDSVVSGLERLTTAFVTVLIIEVPAIMVIGLGEEILERTTHRKFHYKPPADAKPRQPGSNEPLAPGASRPSIYLLELPIPLPPDRPNPRATSAPERSAPELAADRERARSGPERPAAARPSSTQAARPDAPTRVGDSSPVQQTATRREGPSSRPRPTTGQPDPRQRPAARTAPDSPTRLPTATQAMPSRQPAPPAPATRDSLDQRARTDQAPRSDRSTDRDPRTTPDTHPPDRRAERMPPATRARPLDTSSSSGPHAGHPASHDRASFSPVPTSARSGQPPHPGDRPLRPSEPEETGRPPVGRSPIRDQRDAGQRAPQETRSPQRRTPALADDDVDVAGKAAPEGDTFDELEYVPFDDIEIPDDDDL